MQLSKNKFCLLDNLLNPLLINSLFILLSSISNAAFGFIFWMIAAKIYPQEDVGVATAAISSMAVLIFLSRFGLDQSIIRFFPSRDKNKILSTSSIVVIFFTTLIGIVFIFWIDFWSPELGILKESAIVYIIFLLANSLTNLTGIFFIALRKTKYYLLQNFLIGIRIIFVLLLVNFGFWGIYCSVGISFIIAFIYSAYVLLKLGFKQVTVDTNFLKESFEYSKRNYIVSLLTLVPSNLLPIMVLNILGAKNAAYYYIDYAITSFLFMVPTAFSTSVFVEGSYGESLKKSYLNSSLSVFLLLIPLIIFFYFFGGLVLGIIDKSYVQGFETLKYMVISSLFYSINQMYFSLKRVQNNINTLIFLSGFTCILLMGSSYIFMQKYGLIGLGYSWNLSYILSALVIGILMKKEHIFE